MENYSYNSYPDSGESSPRSREIDFENPPPWEDNNNNNQQNPQNYKAKFMCSYGGKIHPRPHDNQLAYIGGETKILSVDRGVKFSSMINKLIGLCGDNEVTFKYQLPGEDLDALISVTNDDDLEHMMHEYDRLYRGSAKPARMRLFLFPATNSTTPSFGSEGVVKSDRDRFVEALNSGPTNVIESAKKIVVPGNSNADFLFGLEKGIPAQKIPEPVAVVPQQPPPPDYQLSDSDRVVETDHAVNPIEIQRQLQRLQIREHEQQVQQAQEAMYMRKSDDNLAGMYAGAGDYYVSKMPEKPSPATLPMPLQQQQTPAFWPEKQVQNTNYPPPPVTTTTAHEQQQQQQMYMISSQGTAVYHSPAPQMIRTVAGQPGQTYYTNMQRMAPPPAPAHTHHHDVYRDQPVYNMPNMVLPQHTQSPSPMSAAPVPQPSLPPMGMVRSGGIPGGGGGGGMGMTTDAGGYAQMAYDSGGGRQVYYTTPGGGMMVQQQQQQQPQYQGGGVGVGVPVSGALSQEGKVVNKIPQTQASS